MGGDSIGGARFEVEGGVPLSGTVRIAGNKNEALPVLAATLLVPGETRIDNVPRIRDVQTLIEILTRLGVGISFSGEREVTFDGATLSERDPDQELASEIRGSFLLAPGLLHRTGKAVLPKPGGDRIGRRRVDTHLLALKALGAEVDIKNGAYHLSLEGRFQHRAELRLVLHDQDPGPALSKEAHIDGLWASPAHWKGR